MAYVWEAIVLGIKEVVVSHLYMYTNCFFDLLPTHSVQVTEEYWARGGGGGGHCLFEGSYPLTNYHPHFSDLSAPEFSLTAPYFWDLQITTL